MQLLVSCVGGSSESILRSSERLVKRKSCSPDSRTSTSSIFCLCGRLSPLQLISPACVVTAGAQWQLENETLIVFFYFLFYFIFYQTLLDLFKSFRKSSKVTIRHPNSSVCFSSLHRRISTSHPEANPVMEISDDTAASFKMVDFNPDFLT